MIHDSDKALDLYEAICKEIDWIEEDQLAEITSIYMGSRPYIWLCNYIDQSGFAIYDVSEHKTLPICLNYKGKKYYIEQDPMAGSNINIKYRYHEIREHSFALPLKEEF